MATPKPTRQWNQESPRPDLVRVVGALTALAVMTQLGATFGIEVWLEQSMFAMAPPAPEAIALGSNRWAVELGSVSTAAMNELSTLTAQANHYRNLAMSIAWTTAATVAVLWMRFESRSSAPARRRLAVAMAFQASPRT